MTFGTGTGGGPSDTTYLTSVPLLTTVSGAGSERMTTPLGADSLNSRPTSLPLRPTDLRAFCASAVDAPMIFGTGTGAGPLLTHTDTGASAVSTRCPPAGRSG